MVTVTICIYSRVTAAFDLFCGCYIVFCIGFFVEAHWLLYSAVGKVAFVFYSHVQNHDRAVGV